jgi:hypothetical protein
VTYKYAVTDIYTGSIAASRWKLGIGQCVDNLVSPTAGTYISPIDPAVCGAGKDYANCTSGNYEVVLSDEPSAGLVRFNGGMGDGETHLFQITVSGETGRVDRNVYIQPGASWIGGTIQGPLCEPTAVTMAAPSATSRHSTFIAVAAAMMVMGVVSVGVLRKK